MELKNINTKNLYYASNKLSTYANEIYAEMKTAHKLMCEGFITEAQYAAIKEDHDKKIAPYENGADLLTRLHSRSSSSPPKAAAAKISTSERSDGRSRMTATVLMTTAHASVSVSA